ncbi:hypothetical protein F4703DRAFT_1787989 [Phycomyces blakesleeanus]|uniref:Uncharacterized protein n=2 Tax=Phycomyces blakesleeanus TaxID=4837 RepID=A0A162XBP1_PHYB8|nr:hypothetical protein PHYBLDRAFT_158784 [Phycomyces blakesleeanus NRRL 1555(-)]OAD73755.1 hypothetical protein PHYBLDRAFT_158784 [Phycomyces blakesleeanus NRRL 1555(-)]|eukprot:XP_018291795.1 hypothetical protein PHYBLDRAFT_158784 [Phycomyces blakesleeanus NRRL 1555(-)]
MALPSSAEYPSGSFPDLLQRFGSGQDQDVFGIPVNRNSVPIQMGFVRKVYLITICQIITVAVMTTTLVNIPLLFNWLQESKYAWWIFIFPAFIISILVAWQLWMQYFRLPLETQATMLAITSFLMSLIFADLISKLCYHEGFVVIFMVFFGVIGLLLFTAQTRFPFKGPLPIVCTVGSICLSSPWFRHEYQLDPIQILWPISLASIFCIYLVFDLYYAMNGLMPNDYILANLCFYIDVAYPIRCLHHLCELSDTFELFPEILTPRPS